MMNGLRILACLTLWVCSCVVASAAPAFDCSRPGLEAFAAVCADRELAGLDRAMDNILVRLGTGDKLTTMLLRRDQRWFFDALGVKYKNKFTRADDPERQRILEAMQDRMKLLEGLASNAARGLAGRWVNTFSEAKLEALDSGTIRITVTNKATDATDDDTTCNAVAQVKPDRDGWLAGMATRIVDDDPPAAGDPADSPFRLRLRLQGNTLRIVLMPSEMDSFCGVPEQITGSYFLVAAAEPRSGLPAAVVSPSFSCATAKLPDEEEICGDPDLAARDVEIAQAYRDIQRKLEAKTFGFLRDDQRAWAKDNAVAFDANLLPAWDKQFTERHHTGNARNELLLRQNERLAMLTNLEPARQGFTGLWLANNALLIIKADPEKPGNLSATGRKWQSGDYKSHCDFEADGKIVGGTFRSDDSFPQLALDGVTLTVDGRDPDRTRGNRRLRDQPIYCTRMDSAKVRLFPVKPHPDIDQSDGRIR